MIMRDLAPRGLLLLAALAAAPCRAAESPATFIDTVAGRVILALEAGTPPAEKRRALAAIVEQSFALSAIAEQLLGELWPAAIPAERADFQAALRRTVVAETMQRFADYRPGSFVVVGTRAIGGREHLVATRFRRKGGAERDLQWRVAGQGDRWIIVDVLDFGASMTLSKRDEYRAVLRRPQATIRTLVDLMNAQVDQVENAR